MRVKPNDRLTCGCFCVQLLDGTPLLKILRNLVRSVDARWERRRLQEDQRHEDAHPYVLNGLADQELLISLEQHEEPTREEADARPEGIEEGAFHIFRNGSVVATAWP